MRKRLTQIFPFLLPLRQKQRNIYYNFKLKKIKNKADIKLDHYFNNEVISIKENIINNNSGFDIKYQYNKMINLKKVAKAFDGLIIKNNEIFSFWAIFNKHIKMSELEDGLVLNDGKISYSKGGGLCQLSNLLFQTFLYTNMTILERHPHDIESIPPIDENALIGIDATIAQGWLDLKMKNDSKYIYQLKVKVIDDMLSVSILCDHSDHPKYVLLNENVQYQKINNDLYQMCDIVRIGDGKQCLYHNECIVTYKVAYE